MKQSNKSDLMTEIILETFKLNGLLIAAGDDLTRELGLTSARWKVLGALSNGSKAMTVPDIAREMGQSRQAVQRLANEMTKDGLITARHNPKHERAKLLYLTEKGEKIFKKIMVKQAPWASSIASGIEKSDLLVVEKTLKKLNENLGD